MSNARTAPSGPFATSGAATLATGLKKVTQAVPAGSQVIVTRDSVVDPAVPTNWGALGVFVAADRASFTITSSNGNDTSVINWIIL